MGRRILRGTRRPEDPDFDGVLDMTPARFDILYLVHGIERGHPWLPRSHRIEQRVIRAKLGLSGATISKAIKRLVELGLVESGYSGGDRRCKVVWLTDEGLQRIRQALHVVFTGREIARHYRRFISKDDYKPRKGLVCRIDLKLDTLWSRAIRLSEHLGDRADRWLFQLRNLDH